MRRGTAFDGKARELFLPVPARPGALRIVARRVLPRPPEMAAGAVGGARDRAEEEPMTEAELREFEARYRRDVKITLRFDELQALTAEIRRCWERIQQLEAGG